MKQKTAMMELIEELKEEAKLYELDALTIYTCYNVCTKKAQKLLEKEKEQIADAVVYGNRQEAYDGTEEIGNFYYNQTYKQD